MTSHTPTENPLASKAEELKQQIAKATDLSALFKNNTFLKQLNKLPQAEQLKIFEQYKDEFMRISQDPGSAISKWTGTISKNFHIMDNAQDTLNNGIHHGQQILEDLRSSLGQISPK